MFFILHSLFLHSGSIENCVQIELGFILWISDELNKYELRTKRERERIGAAWSICYASIARKITSIKQLALEQLVTKAFLPLQ